MISLLEKIEKNVELMRVELMTLHTIDHPSLPQYLYNSKAQKNG
jgi:hypothetical protein